MNDHPDDQLQRRRQRKEQLTGHRPPHRPRSREPHDDDDLTTLRDDLIARSNAVQTHGWQPYLTAWTYDDIASTAYLLGDTATLAAAGYTDDDAFLHRYSLTLFGTTTDSDTRLRNTRKWFLTTRTQLMT